MNAVNGFYVYLFFSIKSQRPDLMRHREGNVQYTNTLPMVGFPLTRSTRLLAMGTWGTMLKNLQAWTSAKLIYFIRSPTHSITLSSLRCSILRKPACVATLATPFDDSNREPFRRTTPVPLLEDRTIAPVIVSVIAPVPHPYVCSSFGMIQFSYRLRYSAYKTRSRVP